MSFGWQETDVETVIGEDNGTISDHISVMQNEMRSSSPNLLVIDERMTKTFDDRKKLIHSSSVSVVLDTFPALSLEKQARATSIDMC